MRDIRALLRENQSLQPMQRALRLLYISANRARRPILVLEPNERGVVIPLTVPAPRREREK